MSLVELWLKSPDQLQDKHVQQVIAFAGSGRLQDGNDASVEFRGYLAQVPSELLVRYADECLTGRFEGSGFALQDIINQIGRRLGFQVEEGRYRGVAGESGHDGLWRTAFGQTIIVEVKTTDAYRVDLDRIADYRHRLIQGGKAPEGETSILLVVGRQDTGDLEAQIRGSRHAWDVRVTSVVALLRLMRLKETVEDPQILRKISGILVPQEFTRVDGIIDLVFSAAEDVLHDTTARESATSESEESERTGVKFTPVNFHDACADRIREFLKYSLVKQTRTSYATVDGSTLVICLVSKTYRNPGGEGYWFAFHPHQREKLSGGPKSYVAFGCGSPAAILLIPFEEFQIWIEGFNITQLDSRFYWHVQIVQERGRFELRRKSGFDRIDLTRYLMGEKQA